MSNEVTIDLTNYKDRVGQRIQPGRYRVIVDDVEQDTAKSGNQMVNVWLRVVDGEFAGSTLIDRLVLHQNSLFRVVGFMQAIGIPTPKKKLRLNISTFLGKVLDVEVDDGEPYNGRVKSEIRAYYRIAKADADAADASTDLDDLAVAGDEGVQDEVLSGIESSPEMKVAEAAAEVDLDTLSL